MSRGLGNNQRAILEVLEQKGGSTSILTLKTTLRINSNCQSFYRSLSGLQQRGLVIEALNVIM